MSVKNKVLLMKHPSFTNSELCQILSKIFPDSNFSIKNDHIILENIKLTNKYYEMLIDLYISTIDDFGQWINDFTNDEYIDVYSTLAGVVLFIKSDNYDNKNVHNNNNIKETLKKYISFVEKLDQFDESKFYGIYDTNHNSVFTEGNGELIYKIESLTEHNELKNLFDIYDWTSEEKNKQYYTLKDKKNDISTLNDPKDINLINVIEKLDVIKSRYSLIKDSQEAEAFAKEMSENIANLLLDDSGNDISQ
ncbi:Irc6p SCDLUD_002281 [Saccharomycodes ludwigii]|uniref:Irc6p n=1 Tax=Saccharomycodes ludwigii TaxID=36035 RepID=UPI001E8C6BDC|nr:hypothetical protein SCDLUD_002281 [Saccharomycodes ludwigii]KAH3900828.1 hypothetical protein SCDLUD_002281 [Saccharomycodes ludwigii]